MGNGIVLDNYLTTANINTVAMLNISGKSITDLTGIQDFTALTSLDCYYNQLTSLDVTGLTNLQNLYCPNNQLTSLNVTGLTNLQYLGCFYNQLTSLDVTGLTNLESIDCFNNQLTSLNFTGLANLQFIDCYNNQLTNLDVSSLSNLLVLGCSWNQLTNLDVSGLTNLQGLICDYNQLTNLDLSQNILLQQLGCSNNHLTALNVKNGNNINFFYFDSTNNPNLTCIEVDDPAYSTANWTNVDPIASFSLDCSGNDLTYVPDDNLETYLETHDANGNFAVPGSALSLGNGIINDDYVTTSKIAVVTQLNVFMQNIYDLTGIEDFIALTNLNCDNNHLTILDVSQNSALEHLQFNNNQISNLDVSNNLLLNFLSCKNKSLTILDVSNNSNLQILFCSNNQISNLNINTNLEVLNASGNQITNLSLDLNPQIMELNLSNNPLTALSLQNGNNVNIATFDTTGTPNLSCIFVDDAAYSNANWTTIDPNNHFVETQAECASLAIEDYTEVDFSIFPNPTKNLLNINLKNDGSYQLVNIQGQIIKSGNLINGQNIIEMSFLPTGLYYLTIKTKDGTGIKKNYKTITML